MIHHSTPLLLLLESIKQAGSLETYFYHPELIITGSYIIDRADFEYLLAQSYVKERGTDTFGKQYALTSKAEQILSDSLYSLQKEEVTLSAN